MTEAQKANDATRYFIITFGERIALHPEPFDNDAAARAKAEELAKADPGLTLGIFEKTATVVAQLEAKWKGRAA